MKRNLVIFILIPWSITATNFKVSDKNVHATPDMGKVKLYHHDKEGFKVWRDGKMEKVGPENLSSELRTMNNRTLKEYQKHAFMRVSKDSEGKSNIYSTVRGAAGGPILGEACYWGVHAGAMWAISAATNAIVNNVKGVKAGNIVFVEEGVHPINAAIEEGGLPGGAAYALKSVAVGGPILLGGLAARTGYKTVGWMSQAALDNFNAPLTAKGALIGYHSASQSPFAASLVKPMGPAITPMRVGTWKVSALMGHEFYYHGIAGNAGRAQWDAGTTKMISSASSSVSGLGQTLTNGAAIGLGVAAVEGGGKLGTLGGIEILAQAARAWGYAQIWCP